VLHTACDLVVSFVLQPFESDDTNGEIDNARRTGQ
jgi:hypothetical protein